MSRDLREQAESCEDGIIDSNPKRLKSEKDVHRKSDRKHKSDRRDKKHKSERGDKKHKSDRRDNRKDKHKSDRRHHKKHKSDRKDKSAQSEEVWVQSEASLKHDDWMTLPSVTYSTPGKNSAGSSNVS